jgi:excisionase
MNEQLQTIAETQWGERCSIKLDKLLSRVDQIISLLFHLKSTLTVEEASLYLGITSSHLYKLVRKYSIPHSRPTNGRIFFNKEDLDNWIKSRMEIESETGRLNEPEQPHEFYY